MVETNLTEILNNNNLIGVVVDNNDPTFSGRCRIKVYGIFDKLKPELLPWATPISSSIFSGSGSGSLSINSYYLVAFFLFATVFFLPLRVRELFLVF